MSQPDNCRQKALAVIAAIAEKATAGTYIFRGENQNRNEAVKSSLYREYENAPILKHLDIATIQEEEISVARKHGGGEVGNRDLLYLLQHHRGKTNLIDFTEDYLIALFFACDGNLDSDGRFIFLDKQEHRNRITKPTRPRNRVIAQKSIFVEPPTGRLEQHEFEQMEIPKEAKRHILDVLRNRHSITGAAIYNDLHGYVTRRPLTTQTLQTVAEGIDLQRAGRYAEATQKFDKAIRDNRDSPMPYLRRGMMHYHLGNWHQAVTDSTEAIELNPLLKEAYNNRGMAHEEQSNYELALADYNKAIDIDPNFGYVYISRGLLYYRKGDLHGAIQEFDQAIRRDPTLETAYYNRGILRRDLNLPGADDDLREALRLNPRLPMPPFP